MCTYFWKEGHWQRRMYLQNEAQGKEEMQTCFIRTTSGVLGKGILGRRWHVPVTPSGWNVCIAAAAEARAPQRQNQLSEERWMSQGISQAVHWCSVAWAAWEGAPLGIAGRMHKRWRGSVLDAWSPIQPGNLYISTHGAEKPFCAHTTWYLAVDLPLGGSLVSSAKSWCGVGRRGPGLVNLENSLTAQSHIYNGQQSPILVIEP